MPYCRIRNLYAMTDIRHKMWFGIYNLNNIKEILI